MFKKLTALSVSIGLVLSLLQPIPDASAQAIYNLPAPGAMISLSQSYNPLQLKGIVIDAKKPFRFDFLIDKGESKLVGQPLNDEIIRLSKYFLTCLAVPEEDLWVNLSPYEKDRIVPGNFGITLMGKDLLEQDYLLKQIMASLSYPENNLGKQFWQKVYQKSYQLFGTTNIPINTFNKVWILPKSAQVYVKGNSAVVVKSQLDVMLEADYKSYVYHTKQQKGAGDYSEIFREVILPQLRQEVNEGKNFAVVRQVYNAMILATWYKKHLKDSLFSKGYVGHNQVRGVDIADKNAKQEIYVQYLKAYKKCVYNYIKEDHDPITGENVPHKYASGGIVVALDDTGDTGVNRTTSVYGEESGQEPAMTSMDLAMVDITPAKADAATLSQIVKRLLLPFLALAITISAFASGSSSSANTHHQGQLTYNSQSLHAVDSGLKLAIVNIDHQVASLEQTIATANQDFINQKAPDYSNVYTNDSISKLDQREADNKAALKNLGEERIQLVQFQQAVEKTLAEHTNQHHTVAVNVIHPTVTHQHHVIVSMAHTQNKEASSAKSHYEKPKIQFHQNEKTGADSKATQFLNQPPVITNQLPAVINCNFGEDVTMHIESPNADFIELSSNGQFVEKDQYPNQKDPKHPFDFKVQEYMPLQGGDGEIKAELINSKGTTTIKIPVKFKINFAFPAALILAGVVVLILGNLKESKKRVKFLLFAAPLAAIAIALMTRSTPSTSALSKTNQDPNIVSATHPAVPQPQLQVSDSGRPVITSQLSPQTVFKIGSELDLNISFKNANSVRWFKNGQQVVAQSADLKSQEQTATFDTGLLFGYDSGNVYKVIVKNDAGDESSSVTKVVNPDTATTEAEGTDSKSNPVPWIGVSILAAGILLIRSRLKRKKDKAMAILERDGGINMNSHLMQMNISGRDDHQLIMRDAAMISPIEGVVPTVFAVVNLSASQLKSILSTGVLN